MRKMFVARLYGKSYGLLNTNTLFYIVTKRQERDLSFKSQVKPFT